MEPSGITF